jgi:hypothetical protein
MFRPQEAVICQISIGENHHTARTHASIFQCCHSMSSKFRNIRPLILHFPLYSIKIYICIAVQYFPLTIREVTNAVILTIIHNVTFLSPLAVIFHSLTHFGL